MKKAVLLVTCSLLLTTMASPAMGVYAGWQANTSVSEASNGRITIVREDDEGAISFTNLPNRMRRNNLTIRNCQETLASYQAMDRQKAYDKMVDTINGIADATWMMVQMGVSGLQVQQMQSQAESLRDQLDDLKEEEYQKSMNDLARQIDNAIDQIILGGETLYITAINYGNQVVDLDRTLVSLERTLKEMEARYAHGQISQLTLEQMRSTYSSTKSQAESLTVAISKMKASLESLLGEPPTGTIRLQDLPSLTQEELDSISYDDDLAAAKEESFTLYQAAETLEDADEDWQDAKDDYSTSSYHYKMAEHTYQAAVYAHDAAIQSFEVSFDSLFRAIPDARQALAAAQSAVAFQEQTYSASQVKYEQGNLSYNDLLTAQDEVTAAQSKVTSAELTLFTAWNNYRWAVEEGLISSNN